MNPRLLVLALALIALFSGVGFLATREIPAPRHAVDKVIGSDRFLK